MLGVPFSADSSLVANVSQSGSLVKYFLERGNTRTGRQCARGYLATKLLGNASKEEAERKKALSYSVSSDIALKLHG